jgi:FAD/FMN-containing dehydrogenase
MKGVTVDEATKTLTVQGGATWADVDAEAAKFGLCTPGGKHSPSSILNPQSGFLMAVL